MSDSGSNVIGSIVTLGSGSILRMFLGFLGLTVATRVIPRDDLGVYFLIFAIVGLLEVVGEWGLRQSAAKFVAGASGDRERQGIVNNVLTLRLVTMLTLYRSVQNDSLIGFLRYENPSHCYCWLEGDSLCMIL